MIAWSLASAVLLLAVRYVLLRRGLITPRDLKKLSAWDRMRRVCDAADTAHLRSVVGDRTDSDVPRPLSSRGRLPGAGNSVGGDLGRGTGCVKDDTSVSSQFANPVPAVQRAIECRALLDTALAVAQQQPECMPVFIHSHQAGEDGREKRN